jgi:hypothetical protein
VRAGSAIHNFNRFFIRLPLLEKLSFTTLSVLDTLAFAGPMRLTDLTATEQISQPGITQLVTRLELEGLVERHPTRATDAPSSFTPPRQAGRSAGPATTTGPATWHRSSPS